jgi:hypothetical protein
MSADQAVTATFTAKPPLPQHTLTVSLAGSGSGTITSSPAGISCPGRCSAGFVQGTLVTLTATPASGATFTGWSGGGCSGTGSCTVTLSSDQAVSANFNTTKIQSLAQATANSLLKQEVKAVGRKHEEHTLLTRACFTVSFTAGVTGKATDKLSAKMGGKNVLVMKGAVTVSKAGAAEIKNCLTQPGKRLVQQHKKLRLKGTATDSPVGAKPVTVSGTVTLTP